MKFFKTHKKMAVAGLALVVALMTGGAAYAFFTSPGGGTGSATVGTASNLSIHQDGMTVYDSTIAPLRRVSSLLRQFLIQFSELATSFAG